MSYAVGNIDTTDVHGSNMDAQGPNTPTDNSNMASERQHLPTMDHVMPNEADHFFDDEGGD